MIRKPKRPKAIWFLAKGPQPQKKRKAVRRVSDRMKGRLKEYRLVRDVWMLRHPYCEVPGCRSKSQDPHHTRGKVGPLLVDTRFWMAVCRSCHGWIGDNPATARSMGLICAKGLWNHPAP